MSKTLSGLRIGEMDLNNELELSYSLKKILDSLLVIYTKSMQLEQQLISSPTNPSILDLCNIIPHKIPGCGELSEYGIPLDMLDCGEVDLKLEKDKYIDLVNECTNIIDIAVSYLEENLK